MGRPKNGSQGHTPTRQHYSQSNSQPTWGK